jgi:uncharacterized protein YdeI (YjbR/CyaY-like superfamily)
MRAWRAQFEALRLVLSWAGLDEEFKWYKPCYTHGGSNVVIFSAFQGVVRAAVLQGCAARIPTAR